MPAVPDSLRSPQTRAAYLMAHYFDRLGETDPGALADKEWTERTFAEFISLAPYAAEAAPQSVAEALAVLLKSLDIHYIDELAETYLHYPDSPNFDDSLYLAWLRTAAANSPDSLRRDIFSQKAEAAGRNQPGTTAMDFAFTRLDNGSGMKLSDITTPVILIFFDPDCSSCRNAIRRLGADSRISDAVERGQLTVLAVYHDADQALLPEAAALIPKGWIGAWEDGSVSDNELYELILAPTVYVLDGSRRVVSRNPALGKITIPQ